MMSEKKLKPCFCGRTPEIVTRDVEPQEDRFFSGKAIMFVLCECGQCLFDGAFHEGFSDEEDAANAWNYRVTPSPASVVEDAEVNAAMERVEKAADHLMPVGMGMVCRDAKLLAAEVRRLAAPVAPQGEESLSKIGKNIERKALSWLRSRSQKLDADGRDAHNALRIIDSMRTEINRLRSLPASPTLTEQAKGLTREKVDSLNEAARTSPPFRAAPKG